jgi:hypothetical protein
MARFHAAFASLVGATLLFAFAHSSAGAEKKRDWQTGKVLDAQRSRYFAGTVGSADTNGTAQTNGDRGTYSGSTNTTQTAHYIVYETNTSRSNQLAVRWTPTAVWGWKPSGM